MKTDRSEKGMVASAFPDASDAGARVLSEGGNAVDAAVATALALGVCEPQASGLGGQTMMMIGSEKKTIAIDGSSRAPSLAHISAIRKEDRGKGYRATTVPSTPATLWYVHNRYGSLPWEAVVEPAIAIADGGYRITPLQNRLQTRELENLLSVESRSGARYFLDSEKPFAVGAMFKQPVLADTLRRIAKNGVKEFYSGRIAKQIDADMRANAGLLRLDDLVLVPWPIERRPLRGRFRGLEIQSMPPPGAGRPLILALHMIDSVKPELFSKGGYEGYRVLAEVFRRSLLERADRPFDPNFYPQLDRKKMLSRRFAQRMMKKILKSVDRSLLPILLTDDEMRGETTHLSVMDKNGLAVSLTQSIERVYGSKAAADGLGFLYNNYLMDYEFNQPDHPFYLRPNAVPWATVAPSVIRKDDRIWMAVGSPGSERIFSTISQFLLHIIDEGMDLESAMMAPRIHCSLGGKISLEAGRFSDDVAPFFEEHGYKVDKLDDYAFYLGAIHAVMREQNLLTGVAEFRRDGTAAGVR